MADQSKRGGQKKGTTAGANSKQHQGVRPGSTTQKKDERKSPKQKRPATKVNSKT